MELIGKKILIISSENWGNVFLSKHHYAIELAKKNKVWFLNARGNRDQKKLLQTEEINSNLTVIDYYNIFYGFGKIPHPITSLLNRILSKKIKSLIGKIDIVWSFEQAKFFNLKLFQTSISIFHPVDHIPYHLNYKKRIAQSANVIFSVSHEILNSIPSSTPKYFINHGVSNFKDSNAIETTIPIDTNKTNIVYIGNINMYCVDIETIKNSIELNLACDFHFIGPTGNSNLGSTSSNSNYTLLSTFSNVYFHGIVEQKNLIATAKRFDIMLSCYAYNKYPIRLSNSHKILEYLSTGKVVISNYFPSYKNIDDSILKMVEDNKDLPQLIQNIANNIDSHNSEILSEKRIKYALNNSYTKQLEKIEVTLNKLTF